MPAALVTGAASGISRATTERLLADGYDVLAVDLKPDGVGRPFAADLTTREGNADAVATALDAFGRLDLVVANAGIQHVAPVREFPEERWDALAEPGAAGAAFSGSPVTMDLGWSAR
jgi:3-hydroxybutyrate dehydrogenase